MITRTPRTHLAGLAAVAIMATGCAAAEPDPATTPSEATDSDAVTADDRDALEAQVVADGLLTEDELTAYRDDALNVAGMSDLGYARLLWISTQVDVATTPPDAQADEPRIIDPCFDYAEAEFLACYEEALTDGGVRWFNKGTAG